MDDLEKKAAEKAESIVIAGNDALWTNGQLRDAITSALLEFANTAIVEFVREAIEDDPRLEPFKKQLQAEGYRKGYREALEAAAKYVERKIRRPEEMEDNEAAEYRNRCFQILAKGICTLKPKRSPAGNKADTKHNDTLEAENARLRKALEQIVKEWGCDYMECQECGGTAIAKAALERGIEK
jgi:hypothetical protein